MPELRKTKIICTLGPSVDDEETLRQLILAGMNAARFQRFPMARTSPSWPRCKS